MDIYSATEEAYKRGYEDGKRDAVVHGRWINTEEKPHLIYRCSECGDKWSYGVMLHCKYCPNCGAKMDATT